MNGTDQKIRGQTIDKTMAKPVGMVKNQEKVIVWNKAMAAPWAILLDLALVIWVDFCIVFML